MTRRTVLACILVPTALAITSVALTNGYAASLPITTKKMSVFKPSGVPATGGCTSGSQTVIASADAFVQESAPTTVTGSEPYVVVTNRGNQRRWTYLRFELPAMASGCSLTSATLRLFASTGPTDRTLEAYRAGTAWTETSLTWNNRPAVSGTAAPTASGAGWRSWNVTAHVGSQYVTANHGFIIKDLVEPAIGGAVTQIFSSREEVSNRPELIVNWG